MNVDYLKPARFNDLLEVGTKITRFGKASLIFEQTVKAQDDQILLCKADVKVACLDASLLRPCPIPKNIIGKINNAD